MTLLALNAVLPKSLRVKYQLAIGALPIGLMFASFVPLFFFASWLAALLGIPPDSAVKHQPHGTLWITVFLAAMLVFMFLGYALGWIANAAIAKFVFGWPAEQVRAVYLRSEVPDHWLQDGVSSAADARARTLARWEEQRKPGGLRFVLRRGVLAWGTPMFFAMYVVPTLAKGRAFAIGNALFNLALWLVAGAAFGAVIWFFSEATYRKLKDGSEA